MWDALTLETTAKSAVYLAALAYLGAVTASACAPSRPGHPLFATAAAVARLAGAIGVLALLGRAWLHAASVADGAVDRETLRLVVFESRWGGRWQWQLWAALAALGVALTRGLSKGAWGGAALVALGWCLATPLLGHGVSTWWQQALHAAHLAVTGAWLGTVVVLAVFARGADSARLDDLAAVVTRFSPWALACAAGAATSGAILALTYLGPVGEGLRTPYGRWLLAKLALVAAAGGCGFGNWRRSRAGRLPVRRLLHAEAIAAVAVALATAILTETAHP